MLSVKYKGFSICQNYELKWFKNKLSGHEWSESIPLKTFSIHGPFTIHTIHNSYKSLNSAMVEIDFIIRWGLHLPENNGC